MAGRENINSFLFSLFGFQKIKSRSHLLIIIFIHFIAWCLFLLLPLVFYPIRFSNNRLFYSELLSKLAPIGFFYLNYYVLLPRFFEKRKLAIYFGTLLASVLIIAGQEVALRSASGAGSRFFQVRIERPFPDKKESPANYFIGNSLDTSKIPIPEALERFREPTFFGLPRGIFFMSINRSLSLCTVFLLIGGLIRLGYSFLKSQNERKVLENAHLNAEVNFLKSQINPHFLFNTLNTIYSQAHNKSEQTEYSILKLSDLMRYVLYDSAEEKVDLDKDIRYLSNYIELQKLRLSSKITVQYEITGITKGKKIAPLLLITFVENAFKHGISYTNPSSIEISIWIFEKTLTLLVSNPVTETNSFAGNGLGLKNVRRRLDLLYPGRYLLDIVQNDRLHVVNLKINLESD